MQPNWIDRGAIVLRATGGGLTAGKSKIVQGNGTFSEAANIRELFGSDASAEVDAGRASPGQRRS